MTTTTEVTAAEPAPDAPARPGRKDRAGSSLGRYVLVRFALIFPTIFILVTTVFVLMRTTGDPITASDVRHSVERLFADFIVQGPKYLQGWLANDPANYRDLLPGGPYEGDHLPDSVLETPDERTIIFHFEEPQLDLPYAPALKATRKTERQSKLDNSRKQYVNVGGAFAVDGDAMPTKEPVLLIDDTVDSRWTLTEAGRELRRAGVVAVWPLALASSGLGG